ncbi:uncharacterized protein LOC113649501, partial [Tachysurus fulvidraco]|uniref:uncharacterized protein LOC113649501 n=1 Tax=Tachysurus fulvidraco TaxID=1234273 RepID=UPI001FEEA5C5
LQSFTKVLDAIGPDDCCFRFQTRPIPVRVITEYGVTNIRCAKPGVFFTLQNGRQLCADPSFKWVKYNMKRIDQRLFNSLNKPDVVDGPDQCCTKFRTQQIPVRDITVYEVTDPKCRKPGVIFTLENGLHVCADPKIIWVKNNMNRTDERLFSNLNNTEDSHGPALCCYRFQTQPIPISVITAYEVTEIRCEKPGVIAQPVKSILLEECPNKLNSVPAIDEEQHGTRGQPESNPS